MPRRELPTHQPTLDALETVDVDAYWRELVAEAASAERMRDSSAARLRELVTMLDGKQAAIRALAQLSEMGRRVKAANADQLDAKRARDRALLVLHTRHGWRLIDCYNKYEIGRHKLNKSFWRLSGDIPDWSEKAATRRADRYHKKHLEYLSIETTAREKRDEIGHGLATGKFDGVKLSGAEIARRGSLTSARVAQMKTGSSNARRAERERRRREQARQDGMKVAI